MDSTEFLPVVNWETTIYDVVLISEETEENPAVWECRIKPKDLNNIGSDIPVELDFQLVDNSGHVFRITNKDKYTAEKRVQVTDIFRVWPECPHTDLTAIVCKTVGDGEAPHITPAMLSRLDETAKDYLYSLEKDILWKYPKDINERWYPEGLLFSVDQTNNKVINWTSGKFVVTKWPDGLESEYRIDNVINKSGYHPERKWNINLGTFTCNDNELAYIYAVIPTAKNELSGSIIIENNYRFERYYTGMLTILLGVYNLPDSNNKRELVMQWSNSSGTNITIIDDRDNITNISEQTIYYESTTQQFITYINNEWNQISSDPDTITPESENITSNGKHTHKFEPGKLVTQTAHGFVFGNTIKRDGEGNWILSKADTRANAGTVGIVSEIIDADHFRYITGGLLPGNFVDGADYWLSTTTAGAIFIQSDTEVWEIGNVREFIGTGTANGLEVEIDLGDEITAFDLGSGENTPKNFLELTDTPDSYEGQGGKAVTVNPDGSGLIFTTPFTPPAGIGFEAVKRIMGTQSNTYPEGIQTSPLIGIRQNNQITIIVQHVIENVWTTVDSAIVEVLMSYREFEPELPASYYLYPIVRPSGIGISDIYLTESDGTFYLNVSLVSVEKWSLDAIARYGPISLSNA